MKGKAQHGSGILLWFMLNIVSLRLLGDLIDLNRSCTINKAMMDATI